MNDYYLLVYTAKPKSAGNQPSMDIISSPQNVK
jgi:hypothetical protein